MVVRLERRGFAGASAFGHMRSRWDRGLWCVVVLGLGARLGLAFYAAPRPSCYRTPDPYIQLATNLLSGQGFTAGYPRPLQAGPHPPWLVTHWPPGYPLFLAGVFGISGRSVLAALVANAVLGCSCVFLLFAVGKTLLGQPGALLAAALVAADWISISYGSTLCSETLSAALLMVAIWLWVCSVRRQGVVLSAGCGIALGAAVMVRAALLAPAMALLIGTLFAVRKPPMRRALTCAAMGAGLALVCTPWCVRNYVVFGRFAMSSSPRYNVAIAWVGPARALSEGAYRDGTVSMWHADLDRAYPGWDRWDPFRQTDAAAAVSGQWAQSHPWLVAECVTYGFTRALFGPGRDRFALIARSASPVLRMGQVVASIAWALLLALSAVTGLVRLAKGSRDRYTWIVLAVSTVALVGVAGAAGFSRFRVPAVPLMALLAAGAIRGARGEVLDWNPPRKNPKRRRH
jgi:4-amino-4-deoxy-L-arabinose transferase-like glycosyltransferase